MPEENATPATNPHLVQFRKIIPENRAVKKALSLLASGWRETSVPEYQQIINGLLEHVKELEKEAYTDPTTEHLNKNAFHAVLRNIVKQRLDSENATPEPVTVVMLDLNYLKPLNNISYHGCGDAAINYLAEFVSKKLRNGYTENGTLQVEEKRKNPTPKEVDLFTRMSSGDEFGIIMKNCTPEQAKAKIQPILDEMAKASLTGKNSKGENVDPCIGTDDRRRKARIQVSAAFGCAQLPDKFPKGFKSSGDSKKDIEEIIARTLKSAGEEEKRNKRLSKERAALINKDSKIIEGGFPALDDREEATKIIVKIMKHRFDEYEKNLPKGSTPSAEPEKTNGKTNGPTRQ